MRQEILRRAIFPCMSFPLAYEIIMGGTGDALRYDPNVHSKLIL